MTTYELRDRDGLRARTAEVHPSAYGGLSAKGLAGSSGVSLSTVQALLWRQPSRETIEVIALAKTQ